MGAVLTLVREAPGPSSYFPQPIRDLIAFVLKRRQLLPPLFDYLLITDVRDKPEDRRDALQAVMRQHRLAWRLWPVAGPQLQRLLDSVYALQLPDNEDPRGRVVEYAVYCSVRIGQPWEPAYRKDYQCAVRWRFNNGRTSRLVDSEATFDVAWLSDISFAGYECKCQVASFLTWGGCLTSTAERKLKFMQDTVKILRSLQRDSRSYLVGLDRNVDHLRELLKSHAIDEVEIIDADELERLLA